MVSAGLLVQRHVYEIRVLKTNQKNYTRLCHCRAR